MVAFQLAGKATRDALFLSTFPIGTLPRMVIGAALLSGILVLGLSRVMTRIGPARLIPALFGASAALLLLEWSLVARWRPLAAVLFYLHFSALGALLVSGFWGMVTDRFDPRTARRTIGRITVGASLGGLVGGLLPGWVGAEFPVTGMLPLLAVLHLLAGALVLGVRPPPGGGVRAAAPDPAYPALAAFRASPYLRWLVVLVALTAMSEGTLDFVFKARATLRAPSGESLLHLFALFYTATALLGILLQALLHRVALARLGIARSAALLPAGVTLGALTGLFLPGLGPILLARGVDVVLRNSLFRSAYELLFTPVLPREKRATKLLVDVGAARLGDAAAGALIQLVLLGVAAWAGSLLLIATILLSLLALAVARQLHGDYVTALARSLTLRAGPEGDREESLTLLQTVGGFDLSQLGLEPARPAPRPAPQAAAPQPVGSRLGELQSGVPERVRAALATGPLPPDLVDVAVALLAWDQVAPAAREALRAVAPREASRLLGRLLDPDEDFAIRRRLVPVLAECRTPEVVDGLLRALGDRRFEVRYRVGRALARIRRDAPQLAIDRERVTAAVLAEVAVERGLWESRRLIDAVEEEEPGATVEGLLRERADRSLEHVFTLLGLELPSAPLRLAYQALQTGDRHLRGTALEYLAGILPEPIRAQLWRFLEPGDAPAAAPRRASGEALQQLLESRESIVLALRALEQPGGAG